MDDKQDANNPADISENPEIEASVDNFLAGVRERVGSMPKLLVNDHDGTRPASVYEESDGLETLVMAPWYYPADVQNSIARMFVTAVEDRAKLLAMVDAVAHLVALWEARGNHDMKFSRTEMADAPDYAREAVYDAGIEMVESARKIRVVAMEALK
jgi:hypothetical protein